MKWILFTSGCVVALVALGILAVDERDVIWEGRTPLCPYCRAEVKPGSVACPSCDRSFDWRSKREECRWCLAKKDKAHLLEVYRELADAGPLPESIAGFGPYFEAIDVGNCTYCAGIGKVMAGGKEVECPVCRGDPDGRCIACGGSGFVVIGDEGAHRRAVEREDARRRALERAAVADLPLNFEMLIDGDVNALRGYREAEDLVDVKGRKLLEMAHERLKSAFRALHEEHMKRAKEPAGS